MAIKSFKVTRKKGASRREKRAQACTWQNFKFFSLLYSKGYVRTRDLQRELDISERGAQRLMAAFKEEGIIQRDEFDQGKWNFADRKHRWDKMAVSDHDASTLAFICKLSKVFGGQIGKTLMDSVAKQFLIEDQDYPYFMITPRVKSPDVQLDFYNDLYDAITSRNKINLTYQSQGAQKTVKAWPISFIMSDGMWYLGYLLEPAKGAEQEIRTVRYNHIIDVKHVDGEYFEKPAWVKKALKEARNIWFNAHRDIKVVLEVENFIKDYFLLSEYFPLQKIVSEGKSTFRVETTIAHPLEAIPNIMRFIPYIRVVSPPSLKKDVLERVQKYLAN